MKNKKPIKVAFPHMGNVYIGWAAALKKMGVEPLVPPRTSKRTLELANKYSPESICLPYKLVLGNFLQAIEKDVDYVAMISSPGICRLGEYGQSIKHVLTEMGHGDKYLELQLYDGFNGMYRFLAEISDGNPVAIVKAINIAIRKMFVLDKVENIFSYYVYNLNDINEKEYHMNTCEIVLLIIVSLAGVAGIYFNVISPKYQPKKVWRIIIPYALFFTAMLFNAHNTILWDILLYLYLVLWLAGIL